MIEVGSRVRYTVEHFQWLDRADRWPQLPHRLAFLGTVVGTAPDGVASVDWDAGRPWPSHRGLVVRHTTMPTVHLEQNLEEDVA